MEGKEFMVHFTFNLVLHSNEKGRSRLDLIFIGHLEAFCKNNTSGAMKYLPHVHYSSGKHGGGGGKHWLQQLSKILINLNNTDEVVRVQ